MLRKHPASRPTVHAVSMAIEEIADLNTCDPVVWFSLGSHTDEDFLAALDGFLPNWRQDYSRLSFSSEQIAPSAPTVQRGHWKKSFGKYCDSRSGDVGAFPVTYIRIK